MSAAVSSSSGFIRMSRGASCAYAKPRSARSSCIDETPRSNSTPLTELEACIADDVGDLVVDRVGERHPVAEAGETRLGACQSLGIAVDADDVEVGKAIEHGLGVTAEAEGGVDDDGPVPDH